jgi:hypothetical protein
MRADGKIGLILAIIVASSAAACGLAFAQTQAVPTGFLLGAGTDAGKGVLHFDISWQSSSGNLQDLAQCKIGEYVTYPGTDSPYVWPDPAWINQTPNPTKLTVPAADGVAEDNHKPGAFDDFITRTVVLGATQYYWYKCPGTGEVKFSAYTNIDIARTVEQVGPNFQPCALYTITKLGYSASFIPNKIVTCTPQPEEASFAQAPSQSLLRITARPVAAAYGLGEPVFVDLQVTNLGTSPTNVDLGGDGKTNLRVVVMGPDGRSKPVRLPSAGLKASGKHMLGAGATFTERLILNEWKEFREAGDYSVNVALVPEFGPKADDAPAADLQVSIGPRDESKLRAVAKALADRAIDGVDVADRDAAALALSHVADPVAIPEMGRVLAIDSDAGLVLIGALARMGGYSAVNMLQSAQNSPNEEVRDAAVRALRAVRDGKPVSPGIAD